MVKYYRRQTMVKNDKTWIEACEFCGVDIDVVVTLQEMSMGWCEVRDLKGKIIDTEIGKTDKWGQGWADSNFEEIDELGVMLLETKEKLNEKTS